MALEKLVVLNKLEINVQNPSIDVVKRVSFMEDGVELNRTHVSTNYNLKNEHLIVSESQLVQDIWAMVSGSEFVL